MSARPGGPSHSELGLACVTNGAEVMVSQRPGTRRVGSVLLSRSHSWKGLQGTPWRPPHRQERGGSEVVVSPVASRGLTWGAASPAPGEPSDDRVLLTA